MSLENELGPHCKLGRMRAGGFEVKCRLCRMRGRFANIPAIKESWSEHVATEEHVARVESGERSEEVGRRLPYRYAEVPENSGESLALAIFEQYAKRQNA